MVSCWIWCIVPMDRAGSYLICCCWAMVLGCCECRGWSAQRRRPQRESRQRVPERHWARRECKEAQGYIYREEVQPCRSRDKFNITLHPLHRQPRNGAKVSHHPNKITPQAHFLPRTHLPMFRNYFQLPKDLRSKHTDWVIVKWISVRQLCHTNGCAKSVAIQILIVFSIHIYCDL